MIVEIGLILMRLYGGGLFVLALNGLSLMAFNPTRKQIFAVWKSLLFIPFWPLAIFSPAGRNAIFNRITKL